MTAITYPPLIDTGRVDQILKILAAIIARGERCPTLDGFMYYGATHVQQTTKAMAEAGIIRIEVLAKNYRVVYICQGPLTGQHTKLPERRSTPYRVLGPARPVAP